MKKYLFTLYKYSCLNIYSGKYYELRTKNYYKKGTILDGEYEVKELIYSEIKTLPED